MNLFWQSLSQAGVWACAAFGTGVLLTLTGLLSSDVSRRRRRLPMSAAAMSQVRAGVIGAEGTWRRKFCIGLFCVLFLLPLSLWPSVFLVLILPMGLGMVAAVLGTTCLFYQQVAWRALYRWEPESAEVLSWGLGLRLMFQRMRGKRGARLRSER